MERAVLLFDQINKERRFMERSWAEQAKHVERLTVAAGGLYGDLHGIIGSGLQQFDGLDFPTIDGGDEPDTAFDRPTKKDETVS